MTVGEKKLIDAEVVDTHPHYEPYGWHHWPDFPVASYSSVARSARRRKAAGRSPRASSPPAG